MRQELGLYANLRPALLFPELSDACPLKPELVEGGVDLLVVKSLPAEFTLREKGQCETECGTGAYDVELYTEKEVERMLALLSTWQ